MGAGEREKGAGLRKDCYRGKNNAIVPFEKRGGYGALRPPGRTQALPPLLGSHASWMLQQFYSLLENDPVLQCWGAKPTRFRPRQDLCGTLFQLQEDR